MSLDMKKKIIVVPVETRDSHTPIVAQRIYNSLLTNEGSNAHGRGSPHLRVSNTVLCETSTSSTASLSCSAKQRNCPREMQQ